MTTIERIDAAELDVHEIELFTLRRRDKPSGPVLQALWGAL